MKNILRTLANSSVILSGAMLSQAVSAADGEITFVGNITSVTCTINNGSPDFQVTLPTVSTQTLNAAGLTAGRTPFKISLSDCSDGINQVGVYFEPGSYTSLTDNRLINSVNPNSNVQIQLRNADASVIKLGEGSAQGGQTVPVNNGSADLTYFAEYYATGVTAPGAVNSATQYTIIYP